MPLGPVLMRELGVGTHEFGLLVSSYTFSAAFTGLLAAMFVDRFERKRLLLTMFGLFAVATLACGLAPGYWTLLAARGTAGRLRRRAGFDGADHGRRPDSFRAARPRQRHHHVGLLAFHRGRRAAFTLSRQSFRLALSLLFIASCLRPAGAGLEDAAGAARPPARRRASAKPSATIRWRPCSPCWPTPTTCRALLFMALIMFSGFTVIPYITIYVTARTWNIRQEDIPLIYLFGGCATFFTSRLIGRLADRHGKIRVYRRRAVPRCYLCW
jgi:hypothetical protein